MTLLKHISLAGAVSQPSYSYGPECRLDRTRSQAFDELMASSPVGLYADLLWSIQELNLTGQSLCFQWAAWSAAAPQQLSWMA
jgi:hypothetical protein